MSISMTNKALSLARGASCSSAACVGWIERYFKDCVCSPSGEVSFGLGMVSLVCWGVAEVPQIVTNFHAKSGHGVSLAFLLTWVLGDIFNLVGCLLEPSTLPTQFYTALLYTISTVVLVMQTVYYDHCLGWWKNKGLHTNLEDEGESYDKNPDASKTALTTPIISNATSVSARATPRKTDMRYMSARSMASSGTPPFGSSSNYLGSGPSNAAALHGSSSDEDAGDSPTHRSRSSAHRILSRSVGYGTFLVGSAGFPFQGKAMEAQIIFYGMGLSNETGMKGLESNPYGVILGWIMAAIYMGGRLPQIYLNIKRGSVEGLNPLMFLFALLANATYVGSILVRSVEWERIKGNAPWLLDAIICVLLDLFIILQFAYYKLMHRRERNHEGYMEAKKPLV